MNIKQVSISEIKPYDNNVKKHPDRQIQSIVQSIKTFGFRQPLVIDKNKIIVAGHARYEAAAILRMESVPCELAEDLSSEQINAYRILDNEIAKQGETDIDALHVELAKLPDFDFAPFNLDIPKIETINEGLCDADEVPEFTEKPKTKMGDCWRVGQHWLKCGDSTNVDDVVQLHHSLSPIIMITDPPYGVKLDQSWRDNAKKGQKLGSGNSNLISNDDRADWSDVYSLFTGYICYLWHASKFTDVVKKNLEDCGFDVRQMIIWNKSVMVLGRGAYHWKHEPCWYAVKKGFDANWKGDRSQTTVWDAVSPNHIMGGSKEEKTSHPTQKPVLLFEIPIKNHTLPNDIVYDPFGGSGTTLIACEKTNRTCLMMEISPLYCDVIINRWQKFTARDAILESTGQTYNEMNYG